MEKKNPNCCHCSHSQDTKLHDTKLNVPKGKVETKSSKCNHNHFCSHDQDIKRISTVFVLICIFMGVELWGHLKSKSLSLLADALHLLVDISGFMVSIFTLKLSKRPSDHRMTFGYERAEIIGALFSVFFIWGAVIYLVMESVHKYLHPKEIDGKTFLIIATVGLLVNLVCMAVLHNGHHSHHGKEQNLNMRATYIHVIGDIIQSVGVMIASAIIFYFPTAVIADILCTLFFALLVVISTFYVVRDAIRILAEGAPSNMNLEEIKERILAMKNVIKITDLKAWCISVNKTSIMVKVLTDTITIKEHEELLIMIKDYLGKEKKIDLVNVQIDTSMTVKEATGFEIEGLSVRGIL